MFASISFLFCNSNLMLTVKAILFVACHLPNPFTNEYQSRAGIISSVFSIGLEAEEDVVSCQSCVITFYKIIQKSEHCCL